MNTKHLGVIAILLASIMWAIEPILAKLSYTNSDVFHTSALRAFVAACTAFIYILLTKQSSLRVTRQQISPLLYIAFVGTLIADFMYFFALSKIPVINAVILGHMQPVFIIAFGFFLLKTDVLTKFDYLGIGLMILSGLLVTTKTMENFITLKFGTIGDLIVLIATITWATAAIVMKKYLTMVNAGVITFYRFFFPSLVFAAYLGLSSSLYIANMYQVYVGVIIGIGTILYYEGLKRLKTAQVGGLELSTPFFAALLALLFLNEQITGMQIIGIVTLFGGVYLLSKKEKYP
ncbi:MAG: DMT family transporter [Candidatus Thermoplasmatota archaeon]|nr:DMT family transporter [Candidatus Thermoplasmatota archaeon]